MCLNDPFSGITHLINPMALIKTGPIMAIFKRNYSKNVKNCQNIDCKYSKFTTFKRSRLEWVKKRSCLYILDSYTVPVITK